MINLFRWLKDKFAKGKKVTMNIPDYKEICKTLKIDENRLIEIKSLVAKFKSSISRYQKVSELCFVEIENGDGTKKKVHFPIDLMFALHYRESSLRFGTCLHNGDALPGPTTHEPKGRGPFSSWEQAAVDALMMKKSKFPKEWTFENRLEFAEIYNGLGYRSKIGDHGVIEFSPYVFAGTSFHDETGKYVSDGKYKPTAKEEQLGVAAILLEINQV